jgi:hypothetical protein
MVVTMLEARVPDDHAGALIGEYRAAGDALPSVIVETFLLHAAGSDLWRIVTVWASRAALDEYRRSVETPAGILMFRAAGAEPSLTIFDVESHAAQS